MAVPVTTIGGGTVPRRMAGTVAGHDMGAGSMGQVIETWYQTQNGAWRWNFCQARAIRSRVRPP
jgi:hypothetical protein